MSTNAKRFGASAFSAALLSLILAAPSAWADGWIDTPAEAYASETDDAITIATPEQLARLAKECNEGKTFAGYTITLTADLDLSGKYWTPIANVGYREISAVADLVSIRFSGTFDGQGHTISGLNNNGYTPEHKDSSNRYAYGLFGTVHSATIRNLKMADVSVSIATGDSVGAIVGFVNGPFTMSCCETVSGDLTGKDSIGGLVGRDYNKDVTGDSVYTSLTNRASVHGITGKSGGVVSYAQVTLGDLYMIGLVNYGAIEGGVVGGVTAGIGGVPNTRHLVQDCINNGTITGITASPMVVGGVTGYNSNNSNKPYEFVRCQNNGNVTGLSYTGGIFGGYDLYANFTDCTNTADIVALTGNAGALGAEDQYNTERVVPNLVTRFVNTGKVISQQGAAAGLCQKSTAEYVDCCIKDCEIVGATAATAFAKPGTTHNSRIVEGSSAKISGAVTTKVGEGEAVTVAPGTYFYKNGAWEPVKLAITAPTVDNVAYTNVVLGFDVTDFNPSAGETASIKVTVKDQAGEVVGSYSQAVTAVGEQTVVIDSDKVAGFVPNKTYTYETEAQINDVTYGGCKFANGYLNVGWLTNEYFAAVADGENTKYVNGAWTLNPPATNGTVFAIDATQTVFTVSEVKQDEAHQIVTFQCTMNVEEFYHEVDLEEDAPASLAALALVTNGETSVASWKAIKDGTTWVAMEGLAPATGNYDVKIDSDYSAGTTPLIRYSVKPNGSSEWTTLTYEGKEWITGKESAAPISKVGFVGTANVAGFGAQLSTKNLVFVGEQEYASLTAAFAAAKVSGAPIVLFTNLKLSPAGIEVGDYTFIANGKTVTPINVPGAAPATEGGKVVVEGDQIKIVSGTFLAELSDGEFATDGNLRFLSLNEATASLTNGVTIYMLADDPAVAATINKAATLNLRGFTVGAGDASKPILTIDEAAVSIVGEGAITGAVNVAAIAADNAATLVIDGIAVTNNAAGALSAANGAQITVNSGWFQQAKGFATDEDSGSQILFVNGFYADVADYQNNVKATGGYYAEDAANDSLLTNATTDAFIPLAVSITTNGVTFTKTIGRKTDPSEPTKVYVVTNAQGEVQGAVQLPDTFVADATDGKSGQDAQDELQKPAAFNGGETGMTKWHCYVLGLPSAAKINTTEGPFVKGIQDADPTKIGFKMLTPSMIKAVEAGCTVEYKVEAYDGPTGSKIDAECSEKVNYDQTAIVPAPASGVRFYKLKVFVTPNK